MTKRLKCDIIYIPNERENTKMRKHRIRNYCDDHMNELMGARASCASHLMESASIAYVFNQTLSVYLPDSPDYNSAKRKLSLLKEMCVAALVHMIPLSQKSKTTMKHTKIVLKSLGQSEANLHMN